MINRNRTWDCAGRFGTWKIAVLVAVLLLGIAALTNAQEKKRGVAEIQADIDKLQAELQEAKSVSPLAQQEGTAQHIDNVAKQDMLQRLRAEERQQPQVAHQLQEIIRTRTKQAAARENSMMLDSEALKREASLANARLTTMKAIRKAIVERIERPTQIPLAILVQINPELAALNKQKEVLIRNRESMVQQLTRPTEDPQIQQLDKQIQALDDRIKNIVAIIDETEMQGVQDRFRTNAEASLYNLDQEIREQEILAEELATKYNEQLVANAERAENLLDASFAQAQLDRLNSTLNQIESQILTLQSEAGKLTVAESHIVGIPDKLEPLEEPFFEAYPMTNMNHDTVIQLFSAIISPSPGLCFQPYRGSLFVMGRKADHERVKEALEQLREVQKTEDWDALPEDKMVLRTYTLPAGVYRPMVTAFVESLAPNVRLVFERASAPGRGVPAPLSVTLFGRKSDHARVQAMFDKMFDTIQQLQEETTE